MNRRVMNTLLLAAAGTAASRQPAQAHRSAAADGSTTSGPTPGKGTTTSPRARQPHPYVGMWRTQDGHVRHELLPNNRYDEARGKVQSAYRGRYRVTGNHIDYWDDTGFTADGEFRDGVLYHGGMVLFREGGERDLPGPAGHVDVTSDASLAAATERLGEEVGSLDLLRRRVRG